jgi:hypothetical protein
MMEEKRERLEELLAGFVTGDITDIERGELSRLLDDVSESEVADWEVAAAELSAALVDSRAADEKLPDHLAQAVVAQGRSAVSRTGATLDSEVIELSSRRRPNFFAWAGWAAAAVAVLFLWGSRDARQPASEFLSVAALRDSLVATDGNLIQLAWSATEDEAALGASGDVVWSDGAQTGVMRFRGLQINDPALWQYQLWIFDAARDERFPVDGGVFDIPPEGGEVLIPIDARLEVDEATLFAVTVERPGGVVVSDRERIVMVAQVT